MSLATIGGSDDHVKKGLLTYLDAFSPNVREVWGAFTFPDDSSAGFDTDKWRGGIGEPTNYLDLETMDALEDALRDWRGTLIIASHDRWLIEHWHGSRLHLRPMRQSPST